MLMIYTLTYNHFVQVCHKVSYLDPYNFSSYFSTLPQDCLECTDTLQYADDTVIYTGHKDIKDFSKTTKRGPDFDIKFHTYLDLLLQ